MSRKFNRNKKQPKLHTHKAIHTQVEQPKHNSVLNGFVPENPSDLLPHEQIGIYWGMTSRDFSCLSKLRNLSNIRRCNTMATIRDNSVAEHSYYTAVLAMTIAMDWNAHASSHNQSVHQYDFENQFSTFEPMEVLLKALYHDIEEAWTGDVVYPLKHHDKQVHAAIADAAVAMLNQTFNQCSKAVQFIKQHNQNAKDNTPEGKLVEVVDMLELAWYAYDEITMGNKTLLPLLNTCCEELNQMELHGLLMKYSLLYQRIYLELEALTEG